MTRIHWREIAVEATVVGFSGSFLTWYVCAKIAAWPWGSWTY